MTKIHFYFVIFSFFEFLFNIKTKKIQWDYYNHDRIVTAITFCDIKINLYDTEVPLNGIRLKANMNVVKEKQEQTGKVKSELRH